MNRFQVVVGNLGIVYDGTDYAEAHAMFDKGVAGAYHCASVFPPPELPSRPVASIFLNY